MMTTELAAGLEIHHDLWALRRFGLTRRDVPSCATGMLPDATQQCKLRAGGVERNPWLLRRFKQVGLNLPGWCQTRPLPRELPRWMWICWDASAASDDVALDCNFEL